MFFSILLQSNLGGKLTTSEELVKHDPYGIFLTIVSISIVMTVLLLIYLAFRYLSKIVFDRKVNIPIQEIPDKIKIDNIPSGVISAAIAMALHLYKLETEAEDRSTLTINKITHKYSPWSSKIYGMRNFYKK